MATWRSAAPVPQIWMPTFVALAPRVKSARLDLVDLRHAGPLLAFEVARSGQVLSSAARLFRQFQSLASGDSRTPGSCATRSRNGRSRVFLSQSDRA